MSLSAGEIEVAGEASSAADLLTPGGDKQIEGRSLGRIAWTQLKHDKLAMAGGIVVIILALLAIFARPITSLYGYSAFKIHGGLLNAETTMPNGAFGGISGKHWLGVTPVNGQDILAQLIYGARTSLIIAVLAVVLALVLGITCGLLAGYFRGATDTVISRSMDTLLAFPVLLFSIALLTIFNDVHSFIGLSGQPLRFGVIIFVLGFFAFAYIGRIVRGQVLSLREKEFVEAARSLGASNFRIMTREILPNLVGPILVWATLSIPNFILGAAGLSYLGVGVQPPTVGWGSMLSDAGQYFQIDPMYLFCPGVMIFIAVMAFNLFGDGLRDALDPRSIR